MSFLSAGLPGRPGNPLEAHGVAHSQVRKILAFRASHRGTSSCMRRAQPAALIAYWQKVTAKPSEKLNSGVPESKSL